MKNYFKGWYFKAQNNAQTVALIVAMHIDEKGHKSASLQIISENGVWCEWFPYEKFECSGNKLQIRLGDSAFSNEGVELNIKTDNITAFGNLKFGPLSSLRYDIMGPFRYVPFMECRHSVFSMTHTVDGFLKINGEEFGFDSAVGYIEGDRGRSFPKVYAWTQCNFTDESPCSIILSVAEIPLGPAHFTGIIGAILWRGKEYRLASYLGAKLAHIGNEKIVISQGKLQLTAILIKKQDKPLYAPVLGDMKRLIRESPSSTAHYSFEADGRKLFDFESDSASFEYEYDK